MEVRWVQAAGNGMLRGARWLWPRLVPGILMPTEDDRDDRSDGGDHGGQVASDRKPAANLREPDKPPVNDSVELTPLDGCRKSVHGWSWSVSPPFRSRPRSRSLSRWGEALERDDPARSTIRSIAAAMMLLLKPVCRFMQPLRRFARSASG